MSVSVSNDAVRDEPGWDLNPRHPAYRASISPTTLSNRDTKLSNRDKKIQKLVRFYIILPAIVRIHGMTIGDWFDCHGCDEIDGGIQEGQEETGDDQDQADS